MTRWWFQIFVIFTPIARFYWGMYGTVHVASRRDGTTILVGSPCNLTAWLGKIALNHSCCSYQRHCGKCTDVCFMWCIVPQKKSSEASCSKEDSGYDVSCFLIFWMFTIFGMFGFWKLEYLQSLSNQRNYMKL